MSELDGRLAVLNPHLHDGVPLAEAARRAGVPRRTATERLFGTIATELLPAMAGDIPHGNRVRPLTAPALTLSELDAAVGRYVVDTYHHRVHPETGQTPLARWSSGDWLSRMPDSPEALDCCC